MRTNYQARRRTTPRPASSPAPRPGAPRIDVILRVYGERDGRPGYWDWRDIR
mgnify:CR=1 FL=1